MPIPAPPGPARYFRLAPGSRVLFFKGSWLRPQHRTGSCTDSEPIQTVLLLVSVSRAIAGWRLGGDRAERSGRSQGVAFGVYR